MNNTNLQVPDNCPNTSSPDKAAQSNQVTETFVTIGRDGKVSDSTIVMSTQSV